MVVRTCLLVLASVALIVTNVNAARNKGKLTLVGSSAQNVSTAPSNGIQPALSAGHVILSDGWGIEYMVSITECDVFTFQGLGVMINRYWAVTVNQVLASVRASNVPWCVYAWPTKQIIKKNKCIAHPNFVLGSGKDNVALIKVCPAVPSNRVAPSNVIPTAADTFNIGTNIYMYQMRDRVNLYYDENNIGINTVCNSRPDWSPDTQVCLEYDEIAYTSMNDVNNGVLVVDKSNKKLIGFVVQHSEGTSYGDGVLLLSKYMTWITDNAKPSEPKITY